MSTTLSKRYPFTARFKWIAYAAVMLSLAALAGAITSGGVSGWVLFCLLFISGAAYLLSPTWRIAIVTSNDGIEVLQGKKRRFILPFADVKRLLVLESGKAAFIDGGSPDKSVLIPGKGAQADYAISQSVSLIEELRERISSDKTTIVESLRPDV